MPFFVIYHRKRITRLIESIKIASGFLCQIGQDISHVPMIASILLVINFVVWFEIAM